MDDLENVAAKLVERYRQGQLISGENLPGCGSLEEGLAIQAAVTRRLGASIAGWKVALPVDGAVLSAPIFAADTFASPAAASISGRMTHGVECELAFRIARELPARPDRGYSSSDVAPCIGGVMAAFELLQSRLVDGFQSPRPHLLADRLGNGGVVLGEIRADWRWRNHADVPVEVCIDGAAIASQQGGNPVGDPFSAVVALAEHLAARGMALLPGQFVMTGAYTGVHHLKPGQRIELRCEGLQPVELQALDADQTSPIPKESLYAGR